jgi:N-methylhydantoinase B
MKIDPGQMWVGVSSGGGGYGDPLNRSAQKVCEHVRDEIISLETARDIYGVVMDPVRFELDETATVERRSKIAAERGTVPMVQPTAADSATWLKDNMREGDNYLLDPLP